MNIKLWDTVKYRPKNILTNNGSITVVGEGRIGRVIAVPSNNCCVVQFDDYSDELAYSWELELIESYE